MISEILDSKALLLKLIIGDRVAFLGQDNNCIELPPL